MHILIAGRWGVGGGGGQLISPHSVLALASLNDAQRGYWYAAALPLLHTLRFARHHLFCHLGLGQATQLPSKTNNLPFG